VWAARVGYVSVPKTTRRYRGDLFTVESGERDGNIFGQRERNYTRDDDDDDPFERLRVTRGTGVTGPVYRFRATTLNAPGL